MDHYPFDWGCTVRVKSKDPPELASVCGFRKVETEEVAAEYDARVGEYLVLVEFGDGASREVPAAILEVVTGDERRG